MSDNFPFASIGLVFTLTFFILHNTPLFIQFRLINGSYKMSHPVAFEKKHLVERCSGNNLEIICTVIVGCSVQIGSPNAFERLKIIFIEILTSVEHQVFKEMGKSGSAGLLIFGTYMVPNINCHNWRFVILVNNER